MQLLSVLFCVPVPHTAPFSSPLLANHEDRLSGISGSLSLSALLPKAHPLSAPLPSYAPKHLLLGLDPVRLLRSPAGTACSPRNMGFSETAWKLADCANSTKLILWTLASNTK